MSDNNSSQSSGQRGFSEERHTKGAWNTRISSTRNPLKRALWDYISFKRQGISRLAKSSRKCRMGLELGCGNGAYAGWFTAINPCTIVANDWSFNALTALNPAFRSDNNAKILRICADAQYLPFKAQSFDFFYSVDVLGHITEPDKALDELVRTVKPSAPFFLHSECADYRCRWPDNALIKRLGKDYLAEYDGHSGLQSSSTLYQSLCARMRVEIFFSPAGLLGWLLGYPEKYILAFRQASWGLLVLITGIFSFIKKAPLLGSLLRLLNAMSNRIELFFGIVGGGSCFASGTTTSGEQSIDSL